MYQVYSSNTIRQQLSLLLVVLVVSGLFLLSVRTREQTGHASKANLTTHQVLFQLKDKVYLKNVTGTYKLQSPEETSLPGWYMARVALAADPVEVANAMQTDTGEIRFAEPDYIVKNATAANSFNFDANSLATDVNSFVKECHQAICPSNPVSIAKSRTQWALCKINQVYPGSDGLDGRGIVVAVLDTGVNYTHPELQPVTLPGYNVFDNGDGMDILGHGTFVAGVVHLVAPSATILPVRIIDARGNTSVGKLIQGIELAANQGAKVINMSFSTSLRSEALKQVVEDLASRNITLVAAAGNQNSANPVFPANIPEVISVAASDQTDQKADFSNFGSTVSVTSPGVHIYSTWWKGGYATGDGTSFAAPIVSAEAAIILHLRSQNLSTAKLNNIVQLSVDKWKPGCQKCSGMGKGIIDVRKVLNYAGELG